MNPQSNPTRSGRAEPGWRPALAASALLHLAALLGLSAIDFDRPVAAPPHAPLELRLSLSPTPIAPAREPAPALEPAPESALSDRSPTASPPPRPSDTPSASATEPPIQATTDPDVSPEAPFVDGSTASERASPQQLRARLLQQIESTATPDIAQRSSGDGSELQGRAVPRLPSARSWLSGHVGAVAPNVDRWREVDGSQRAQVTLADGTVICLQRGAPNVEEMMQPWKSIIVTMARLCRRTRPEAVDYSDLRVQPPPRTASDD